MAASDEQLMERARAGDLPAFGALFDRHQPGLFAFLCRFFGDAATAEDVAQEALWRAWQYRSTFDGRRAFTAWLYTIARHAALDELRRGDRRALPFSNLAESQREDTETRPDGRLPFTDGVIEDLSVRAQVRAALLELPPEQRLCLVLKEYEGKSHREIGEIMGCSEGNARVLTHRARRALRELLKPVLESEESLV